MKVSISYFLHQLLLAVDIEGYMEKRVKLIQTVKKEHFSSSIELQKIEISAETKLLKLRDQMYEEDPSIITGFYYDKYKKL